MRDVPARATCPFCGATVSGEARYCDHCGTPLSDRETQSLSRHRPKRPRRIAVWAVFVVLFLVFLTGMLGGFRYRASRWPWALAGLTALGPGDPGSGRTGPAAEPFGGTGPQPPGTEVPSTAGYLKAVVTVQVRGTDGTRFGSGFLIDNAGHVVTAAHVVGESKCLAVVDDNGGSHEGTVAVRDKTLDVAVLSVPTLKSWPTYLELGDSRRLSPGASVFLVGSPAGTNRSTLVTATFSRVTDKRIDDRPFKDILEVSGATVVSGASGGPLVDVATGRVAGVVVGGSGESTRFAWAVQTDLLTALIKQGVGLPSAGACPSGTLDRTARAILATVTPLSGSNGVWGADLADGVELALRDRETDLRRVGYEVSLKKYDDEGNPAVAAGHARTLDYDPDVIGVVGSLDGPATIALANGLKSSGLAMVVPVSGAEELTEQGWTNLNRLVATTRRQNQAAARFIKEQMKLASVYLVSDGSAEGTQQAAIFETAARLISLPVVERATVSASADFAGLQQKIGATMADVIYYAGKSETAVRLVPGLRRAGSPLPIVGGDAFADPRFASLSDAELHGVYFTQLTAQTSDRFDRHFESVLGKPAVADAAYGYDAARVILDALIQYGTANPGRLPSRAELSALVRATRDYPGYSSAVTFDVRGENTTAEVYLFDWFGGQKELRGSIQ